MLRGVPLYNFSGERVLETLQPVQVRRVICLQFNDIHVHASMFNSALEKLEHMRQHITHEFGTCMPRFFCRARCAHYGVLLLKCAH